MAEQLKRGTSDSPSRKRRAPSARSQLELARLAYTVKTTQAMVDLAIIANEMVKRGEAKDVGSAFVQLLTDLGAVAATIREHSQVMRAR